jgi:hypothetical protein
MNMTEREFRQLLEKAIETALIATKGIAIAREGDIPPLDDEDFWGLVANEIWATI